MKKFRLLRADEIDCRISTVKENGVSLLLYKDARCDMNILDETVGCMNWQKSYSRDNANCTVTIWDGEKQQWISKEDTGTESFTEKEKGLASDSFKRACFNWGIGRELYTAPFIWIPAGKCNIRQKGNGYTCYDRFEVKSIAYDDSQKISDLVVTLNGKVVYSMNGKPIEEKTVELASDKEKARIWAIAKKKTDDPKGFLKSFGATYDRMTVEQYIQLNNALKGMPDGSERQSA